MAALRAFIGLSVAALLVHTAAGAAHAVGGSSGWGLGTDFGTWAASIKFRTGDSLTFSYGALHSVLEVTKADYDSCSTSSPLSTAADGRTAVKLSSPGKRYFICGTPGHCGAGMKVEIDTAAGAAAAVGTPPPAPAAPATPPPASPVAPPPPPAPASPKHRSPAPAKPPTPPKAPASPLSPPPLDRAVAPAPAAEPARPKASVLAATAAPTPPQASAAAAAAIGRTSKVAMGVAVAVTSILMALAI